jgi:hypothetical protein
LPENTAALQRYFRAKIMPDEIALAICHMESQGWCPLHLLEIISRLCGPDDLRIWNGTKERNTHTAT